MPSSITAADRAIRTAHYRPAAGRCDYGVGSGITWSSNFGDELDELAAKCVILPKQRGRGDDNGAFAAAPEVATLDVGVVSTKATGQSLPRPEASIDIERNLRL